MILDTARTLAHSVPELIDERGLTLIGVAVANLDDDDVLQLTLPFDHRADPALDSALDAIRERFGNKLLTRASQLGSDPFALGPDAPGLSRAGGVARSGRGRGAGC